MARPRKCSTFFFAFLASPVLAIAFLALPARAETVRIGGTGTGLGIMRILAEAFAAARPAAKFAVLPSLGSTGGVRALMAGALQIATISRPLSAQEKLQGASEVEYGRTPLVIATSTENPVSGLTTAELARIFIGGLDKWPGGERIRLILRPAGDSDTQILRAVSPGMRRAVEKAHSRKGLKIAVTDQDAADAIETIPGALGTTTLAVVFSERRRVKILAWDGVSPTSQAVARGIYPYFKRQFLVTLPGKPSSAVDQFVAFVRSPAGRRLLEETGHWPFPGEPPR